MSTATTTAKIVLQADNRTSGELRSFRQSLNNIDKDMKKFAQGFKALGVGAVALKGLAQFASVANTGIKNLAETNSEFAKSLREGEEAMRVWRTAGLATTEAQLRFNEALADPELAKNMQALTDQSSAFWIDVKRHAIEGLAYFQRYTAWMDGVQRKIALASPFGAAGEINRLNVEARNEATLSGFQSFNPAANVPTPKLNFGGSASGAGDDRGFERHLADVRLSIEAVSQFEAGVRESRENIEAMFLDTFDEVPEWIKESTDKMSIYADQAARNMQDAFADFLFDPFEDGVEGMAKGFIDAIRRMAAEKAAASLFDLIGGGGGVGGFLGGLLGFADGGRPPVGRASIVGERGPELFVPDRGGTIVPNHKLGGGGITIAPVYNIDARGATTDVMKILPGLLKQTSDQTYARVQDAVKRGRL